MAQKAEYVVKLDWKDFNVSLDSINTWMVANAGDQYCGMQSHNCLEVWFLQQPEAKVEDAIMEYWNNLKPKGKEAKAYQAALDSQAQAEADLKAALKSANSKLKDLGLTDAEIAALRG